MRYTRLQGIDVPLSTAALGTMTFGDTVDDRAAAEIIDAALESGISVIDTANSYSDGRCEELLAGLLNGRGESVVVASKAGMPHPDAGDHSPLSAAGLVGAVEGSLRRLRVERLDLLYLHKPDRSAPVRETMETVAALVRDGKVGALGVSNYAAWQISELNRIADDIGTPRPVVAQQLYNVIARRIEEEYVEFAQVSNLYTVVYNPLSGGLLTGRHSFESFPAIGRFATSTLAEMYRERYWDDRMFAAISELTRIAGDAGLSLVELALRWLGGKEAVGGIVLGASRAEQIVSSVQALGDGPLPADVIAACDAVGAALRGPMPSYNR